jgi:hypothetical protein
MEIIPLGNGSYQSTTLFTTLEGAKWYLENKLVEVWQNSDMSNEAYAELLLELTTYNRLSFGNITAGIIELEEEETF